MRDRGLVTKPDAYWRATPDDGEHYTYAVMLR